MFSTVLKSLILLVCISGPARSAPEPAFTYESMLNIYFSDDSGVISIRDMDLAFAPDGQVDAAVALTDAENTVIKSHKFYPDPRWREGVYARMSEVGPADFEVTKPGIYNIVFLIEGKPVSRLPVILEQTSAGDDPFNPVKTYRFLGMWQLYGYLYMDTRNDKPFPELNLWLGGKDLADGEKKDTFAATLKDEKGVVLAHSKKTQGFYREGHYEQTDIGLYHPHESQKSANALPYMLSDWTAKDGQYTIEVTRGSDSKLLRRFQVTVKDGQIQNLPAADMKYEPHVDYMVPRVDTKESQNYGFSKAIWLKSE